MDHYDPGMEELEMQRELEDERPPVAGLDRQTDLGGIWTALGSN